METSYESIRECLSVAKIEVNGLKKVEEAFKDLYGALIEEKEKVSTKDGKDFIDSEIREAYNDLIQIGVGIGKMEGLINLYASMLDRGML